MSQTISPNHFASGSAPSSDGALTLATVDAWRNSLADLPHHRLAQNAVAENGIDKIALNRQVITATDHTFSHLLDQWPATNQKKSGRCWMFAGLNLFRVGAMMKMNLESFEFSQNYTLFWDKLERANYFLEAIIETSDRPVDDRTVAFLLERPLEDGGQWNMFTNVVRKYGVVPKSVMPETESSSNTRRMNANIIHKLREGAMKLRELRAQDAPVEAARAMKHEILETVYRMLSIHLGTPPTQFDWQWNDKDRTFHRDGTMTPQEFAEKYITLPIDDYVCLVHDPRESNPFGRTYTVNYLGNVRDGEIVTYLNVEIDQMKSIAKDLLTSDEPVWFGCDVGQMMHREQGVWDENLYDYARVYDTDYVMTKRDRLIYHQTLMTHAMLFTGVDVAGSSTRRWRVENSWGEDNGQKGFYVMNDSWFDEYVFEIAAPKSALPAELQDALQQEPTVLPPWDPMGALA